MQLTVSNQDLAFIQVTSLILRQVCNPFGGLGLTGGIVDIGGLYDCLAGIHENKADASILEKYSEVRRQKYSEIIDPISSENIVRLFGQDPDKAMENDEFLKLCKKTETDSEFSRAFQSGVNILKYDFTQHYRTAEVKPAPASLQKSNGVQVSHPLAVVGVSD